ncbi:hypothetical protein C0Q44_24110 [Paenibacillus sp. PCH8]|uniref:hypothetical protein n=1 Tax=Paenibacillus sp. PCH8 TaxID=2066524 RepID=UPI000CF881D6|nr:hypothetical protein [Paenibacillus sp. PCH8]PQP80842.1 hypothetical protein C0Q44_24110 [Paenibacillus sp. PCH8]
MTRRKRNQWRKWQASAAATLTVAALFQYVRTSDAFDVAYAATNGSDTSVTSSSQMEARDDVMDEWISSTTDSHNWNTQDNDNKDSQDNGTSDSRQSAGLDQGMSNKGSYLERQRFGPNNQSTDSGYSSGNYQSRTGAS